MEKEKPQVAAVVVTAAAALLSLLSSSQFSCSFAFEVQSYILCQ